MRWCYDGSALMITPAEPPEGSEPPKGGHSTIADRFAGVSCIVPRRTTCKHEDTKLSLCAGPCPGIHASLCCCIYGVLDNYKGLALHGPDRDLVSAETLQAEQLNKTWIKTPWRSKPS